MRVRILVYLLVIILISILVSINVYSFGISYEYMKDNILELYPGQTYLFELVVQNKEKDDMRVKVTLDSSIATLEKGPEFDVPGNTYDTKILFRINVPDDANPGDIFNIYYLVAPVSDGEGQAPLDVDYDRGFKVKVIPKTEGVWIEEQPAPEEKEKSLITGNVLKPLGKIPVWASLPVVIILIGVLVVVVWRNSRQVPRGIIENEDTESFASAPKEQNKEQDKPIEPVKSVKSGESMVSIKDKLEETKPIPEIKTPEPVAPVEEPVEQSIESPVEQEIKPVLEPAPDDEPSSPEPFEETPEPIEEPVEQSIEPPIEQPEEYHAEHHEESNEQFGLNLLFYLKDGRKLRDIEDLYHVLKNMSPETYGYHVNNYKNDFASWVGDALGDHEMASKISMVNSKQEMFSMIEDTLGRVPW